MTHRFKDLSKRERHYRRILESVLDRQLARGKPFGDAHKLAKQVAARTVNKYRAAIAGTGAAGKRTCRVKAGRTLCRTVRGPQRVSRGGGRQQWYPGKRTPGMKERLVCLRHGRRFKSKAGWVTHFRSHVK